MAGVSGVESYVDFSLRIAMEDERVTIKATSPQGEGGETVSGWRGLAVGGAGAALQEGSAAPATRDLIGGHRAEDDCRRLGEDLYRTFIRGQIKELLASSLSGLRDANRGLRIRLQFDPAAAGSRALSALPWETLYNPDTRDFLGLNALTPVVRHLEVRRPTCLSPFAAPIRILMVAANPAGSAPLDLKRERLLIERAWAEAPQAVLEVADGSDVDSLESALLKGPYHILHFMGHGAFDDDTGQGSILFAGTAGRSRLLPGDVLAAMLKKDLPRLAVINACQSARVADAGGDFFSGLAAALVLGGVPAVVAMRSPISDDGALTFSRALYRRLALSWPLDAAVCEARMTMYVQNQNAGEWATPVLFMRTADGHLFTAPREAASPGGGEADVVFIKSHDIDAQGDGIIGVDGIAPSQRASLLRIEADHVRATAIIGQRRR